MCIRGHRRAFGSKRRTMWQKTTSDVLWWIKQCNYCGIESTQASSGACTDEIVIVAGVGSYGWWAPKIQFPRNNLVRYRTSAGRVPVLLKIIISYRRFLQNRPFFHRFPRNHLLLIPRSATTKQTILFRLNGFFTNWVVVYSCPSVRVK